MVRTTLNAQMRSLKPGLLLNKNEDTSVIQYAEVFFVFYNKMFEKCREKT